MSIDGINSNSTTNFANVNDLIAFEIGGDAGARVAAVLLESAHETRDQSELERKATEKQLDESERAQVDAMYEQADRIRAAGWIQGTAMMASGTLGAIGAMNGLESAQSNAVAAQSTSTAYSSVGNVVMGAGNLGKALEDGASKDCEADASSAASTAHHLERRLQDLQQVENDAREEARSAIQSAGQLADAQGRQQQATLFIRG